MVAGWFNGRRFLTRLSAYAPQQKAYLLGVQRDRGTCVEHSVAHCPPCRKTEAIISPAVSFPVRGPRPRPNVQIASVSDGSSFIPRSRGKRVFPRNRLPSRRRSKNIAILARIGLPMRRYRIKLPIRSHRFGFPARRVNVHAIESSEF